MWSVFVASLVGSITPATTRAQRVSTPDLLKLGIATYSSLPERVTLRDARTFSEALRFLYAYEQRTLRENGQPVNADAAVALRWLLTNMHSMKTGKADGFRNDDVLFERGLKGLQDARKSEENGVVWNVTAFLSGSANLFAYLQCAPRPSDAARQGFAWLERAQRHLVVAGGKGDDWSPSLRRPGYVSKDGRSGREARIGILGAAAADLAGPARGADALAPVPPDSIQALRDSSETARAHTSAAKEGLIRGDEAMRTLRTAVELYQKGRLREARDSARGWLDRNPSDGDAHMLLSQVYAKASQQHATPEARAVAWLVIQHLTIAIKSGAIGHEVGQRLLRAYEARIPTSDDLAARGWVAGQRLRVNFSPYEWIDEEATIRARKD